MGQHQRPGFRPPEPGSVSRGTVSRVEPYGCFVRLLGSSPVSGLVHISQLHASRITDVNDVVSLDDEVWIKVMDVQVESVEDESTGRMRQRHKVKLSMKYVHQDTGQDLDPENEQLEGDMQRGGGGNRGNAKKDGTVGGANSQLGRSLASNIGMSIAIDPGNLILKGKSGAAVAANSNINGYALVGEDEGEAPQMYRQPEVKPPEPVQVAAVRSMGRGRGTTLPAWMTRSDPPEDRLGSATGMPNNGKEVVPTKEGDGKKRSRRNDEHKSRKRDKHRKRERHHSSSRHGSSGRSKHGKKHKDRNRSKDRHRRGRSRSNSHSSSSIASRSRSRSRSPRRRKSHKHSRYGEDQSRSRDDDADNGRSSTRQSTADFSNVEEARAIMERLERRR